MTMWHQHTRNVHKYLRIISRQYGLSTKQIKLLSSTHAACVRQIMHLRPVMCAEKHSFSTSVALCNKAETSGGSNDDDSRKNDGDGNNDNDDNMKHIKQFAFITFFMLALMYAINNRSINRRIEDLFNIFLPNNEVEELLVYRRKNIVQARLKSNQWVTFHIDSVKDFELDLAHTYARLGIRNSNKVELRYTNKSRDFRQMFYNFLLLASFGLIIGFQYPNEIKKFFKQAGQALKLARFYDGGKAGKLMTKNTGVSFKDVAGCEEAKIEIMEFVNFLKNHHIYEDLGAKIPKGAILHGPPGTGKTLLAKATAGEAGVPFISTSGSEFIEIFVGVGASRLRKIFKEAKDNAPCILFIDEIDGIGKSRKGDGNKPSEYENTLNQLLVEMDGFESKRGVIVLAATNRMGVLDKALLRPGRFDRHIYVPLPDFKGRASLFKVHLQNIKTQVDKEELSKVMSSRTPGLSGADIMNICNEAALIAVRNDKTEVEAEHFELAVERIVAGIERKSTVLELEQKKAIAYQEAGKVVAGWFLEYASPIIKVSIVPSTEKTGYTMNLHHERYLHTKEELTDRMCVKLGGCVAHELMFGSRTTRSFEDLKYATEMAYKLVAQYGMDEKFGHLSFQNVTTDMDVYMKPYSENLAQLLDTEAKLIVNNAYTRTKALLTEHLEQVEQVAKALLDMERLDRKELVTLLGPRPFHEVLTYEDMAAGTGSMEEDTALPEGLKNWNRPLSDEDGAKTENNSESKDS